MEAQREELLRLGEQLKSVNEERRNDQDEQNKFIKAISASQKRESQKEVENALE